MSGTKLGVWGLVSLCIGVLCAGAGGQERGEPGNADDFRSQKIVSTYKEQVVVERTTVSREVQQVRPRIAREKYSCAIFVSNRTKIDDKKVLAMQDLLTGYVTDKGFTIIAREDAINAVAKLADDGPNRGGRGLPGANLDEILSNNTSALRLAQNLGADYVLMVSLTGFGTDKQRFVDRERGINLLSLKHQLKTTYRVLDTTAGGSMTAGVANAVIADRIDPDRNAIERENLEDDLLDAAAMDMAEMLARAGRDERIAAVAPGDRKEVPFEVHCGVADLFYPEIVKNERGELVVGAGRYRLEAMSVAVELDGVMIGTTPGPFQARPGLHKLRLRRELFSDYEATVKVSENQVLQIALKMSDEGLQRFSDMARLMQGLKESQALTEAQVKVLEGFAKHLEGSEIKIDRQIRGDIRHDLPGVRDPLERDYEKPRERDPVPRDLREPEPR